MKLDDIILTAVKTDLESEVERIQKFVLKKEKLINSIIEWLTENPEELEQELISGFFTIADSEHSSITVTSFQNLWYVLKDAKKLKMLIQEEKNAQ